MIAVGDALGAMDMAERHVVDVGKSRRGKGVERADIDIAHRIAFADADGGEMAGSDNRQRQRMRARRVDAALIVRGDRLQQAELLLAARLARAAAHNIARPQIGNSAEQRARFAGAVAQQQQIVIWLRRGDHLGIQAGEQGARLVERGDRIVIARQHHQLAAGRLQRHHKTVKEFARIAWRRAAIEEVACNDQRINLMLLDTRQQPVEKGLVLGRPALVIEKLTEVPVRGMNDAHKTPCGNGLPENYTGYGAKAKKAAPAVIKQC